MIVSVLRVPAREGAEGELLRAFSELEVFEHARRSGGFRAGRLLRPLEPGEPLLVLAEWDDAAAYQGWLDNPARLEISERLASLLDGEVTTGVLYEDA